MSAGKEPLHRQSPLLRDFELDSEPLGPATRMMLIETDPSGGIFYQFGRRPARLLQLPAKFGLRVLGLIDMAQSCVLLDPASNRMIAMAAFLSVGNRIVLFGENWGLWIDGEGDVHRNENLPDLLRQWRFPVSLIEPRAQFAFDFQVNIHNREVFTRQTLNAFSDRRVYHELNFIYDYPQGELVEAHVIVHDSTTHKVLAVSNVYGFPLNWPGLHPGRQKKSALPEPEDAAGATALPPPREIRALPASLPAEEPPPLERPVPRTEHLPTMELLNVLSTEPDADRRWKIIEPNLMQGRPERTYPMLLQHTDLIAERTREWPAARLRAAFGDQPGSVLTAVMHDWQINQVLAVCEGNVEADRMMEWLREREIERLMKVDLATGAASAEQARLLLNVNRQADATAIKKAWRTLLGFMNADLGRRQERAIHRKKDEIAKQLQTARNILLGGGRP